MSEKIRAPWTVAQVIALNGWQYRDDVHPYTCLHHSDTRLLATTAGWVCPHRDCDYRQDWTHPDAPAPPNLAALIEQLEALADEYVCGRDCPRCMSAYESDVPLLRAAIAALRER